MGQPFQLLPPVRKSPMSVSSMTWGTLHWTIMEYIYCLVRVSSFWKGDRGGRREWAVNFFGLWWLRVRIFAHDAQVIQWFSARDARSSLITLSKEFRRMMRVRWYQRGFPRIMREIEIPISFLMAVVSMQRHSCHRGEFSSQPVFVAWYATNCFLRGAMMLWAWSLLMIDCM